MMIELIANAATSIIGIHFISRYCQPKYAGRTRILYKMSGVLAYFTTVSVLNFLMPFEGVLGLAYLLVMLLYARIACKGNIVEHALGTVIWACIILFSTVLVFEVTTLITNHNINNLLMSNYYLRTEMLTAVTILKFILCNFMLMIKKNKGLFLNKNESYVLIGFCFLILFLTLGFFTMELTWENEVIRHFTSLFLLFGTMLMILLIYNVFNSLSSHNLKEISRSYTNKAIGMQGEYVKDIENLNKKLQIQRHDTRGHYVALHMFLQSGLYEEAARYLEELEDNEKKYNELPDLTDNDGLNAILYKSCLDCESMGITLTCIIHADVKRIKNSDMGILMYNLMTNAIEATSMADKKEIDLEIGNYHGYLKCKMSNTVQESVLKKNPKLKTSKKDKEYHGFGLESIHQVIEKYNGHYDHWEADGKFIQELYLEYPS